MAAISVVSKTRGGFTVRLTGLDSSYAGKTRTVTWSVDSITKKQTLANNITQSPTVVLEGGLRKGGYYDITAEVKWYNGNTPYTSTLTLEDQRTATTPAYYSFDDGEKIEGFEFDLTASEWTGLCNNVNLVRRARGLSNYSFTSVSRDDIFYADYYNEVVNAIWGTGYGDLLDEVEPGDQISAYCLNALVDAINDVP